MKILKDGKAMFALSMYMLGFVNGILVGLILFGN